VSRKTFGPKRKEVTEEWEKLLMKSFMVCTSYKPRTIKWAENVAHMDEKRDTARLLVRNSEERNYLEDLSI